MGRGCPGAWWRGVLYVVAGLGGACTGQVTGADLEEGAVVDGAADPGRDVPDTPDADLEDATYALGRPRPLSFLHTVELSPTVASVAPSYGAEAIPIIYQHSIDPDDDGVFVGEHDTLLKETIETYWPEGYEGPFVLDWEGYGEHVLLTAPIGSPELEAQIDEFIAVIRVVKDALPGACVGYYGQPTGRFYNRDDEWRTRNRALERLYEACDCHFPHVYLPFPTPTAESHSYVREVVRETLENHAHERPVYVFVTHRYYAPGSAFEGVLTSDDEITSHIAPIFKVRSSHGDRADGIVWWSSEAYGLRCLRGYLEGVPWVLNNPAYVETALGMQALLAQEAPDGIDPVLYVDWLHEHLLSLYRAALLRAR